MRPRTLTVAGAAEEWAAVEWPGPHLFPVSPRREEIALGAPWAANILQNRETPRWLPGSRNRPGSDHESTLKTDRYTLTQQNFPSYSVPMDVELATLEEKIREAAALCKQLREENRDLRSRLSTLTNDKSRLTEKVDGARLRLETLLKQIPE
jgi:cell division protein ZapB